MIGVLLLVILIIGLGVEAYQLGAVVGEWQARQEVAQPKPPPAPVTLPFTCELGTLDWRDGEMWCKVDLRG